MPSVGVPPMSGAVVSSSAVGLGFVSLFDGRPKVAVTDDDTKPPVTVPFVTLPSPGVPLLIVTLPLPAVPLPVVTLPSPVVVSLSEKCAGMLLRVAILASSWRLNVVKDAWSIVASSSLLLLHVVEPSLVRKTSQIEVPLFSAVSGIFFPVVDPNTYLASALSLVLWEPVDRDSLSELDPVAALGGVRATRQATVAIRSFRRCCLNSDRAMAVVEPEALCLLRPLNCSRINLPSS